ncbi:aminotransferase class V-fold PLP-dependent enzyme [Parasphingorhabdus sp.]|uniref:aminotransferase class V-fold PLP-dependent enzyme n=1 Tax=Parasphingorhabdus sp. TaxID=2709688 RepID=UPI0032ECD0D4
MSAAWPEISDDVLSAIASTAFGPDFRKFWNLAAGKTFLNHGSFGACPIFIRQHQAQIQNELDAHPDSFFLEEIVPGEEPGKLRQNVEPLAQFIGSDAEHVAYVENATIGIQAALMSAGIRAGDSILISNQQYNAVRVMVEHNCRTVGATVLVADLPGDGTEEDMVEAIECALQSNTRLAIIDHITSSSALELPIKSIAEMLHRRDVRLIVDGAHAIGHIDLDMSDLGADWYVTNAHKWLHAPVGTALFYASDAVYSITVPPVVSHFAELGFPRSFDYVGSRDYTAWLATPLALRFTTSLEQAGLRTHWKNLIGHADRSLQSMGIRPLNAALSAPAMRSYVLPQTRAATEDDAIAVMDSLWREFGIQTRILSLDGFLLLRVSGAAYVGQADIDLLCEALRTNGWPGRN